MSDLRVLVESYVVLGDESEAEYAANLWRFLPIATDMLQVADPRVIQQRAEAEVPINRTLRRFFVSPDPAAHAGRIRELFDAGATDVFIHAPQQDQKKILESFATNILPDVRSYRS